MSGRIQKMRLFRPAISALALAAAAPLFCMPVAAQAQARADQNAAILQFFADYDAAQLARSPISKSFRGIKDGDYGKWDAFTDAAEQREYEADQTALKAMRAKFDPKTLNAENALSYRLFEKMIDRSTAAYKYRDYDYDFDQMNGPQSQLPAFLINIHRVDTKQDAEAYVSRLNGLGAAIDQLITQSRAHAAKGLMPPKWVYPYVISDAKNVVTGFPFTKIATEAPLYADFKAKVGKLAIPQAEKDALLASAADALVKSVKPAYGRLVAEM